MASYRHPQGVVVPVPPGGTRASPPRSTRPWTSSTRRRTRDTSRSRRSAPASAWARPTGREASAWAGRSTSASRSRRTSPVPGSTTRRRRRTPPLALGLVPQPWSACHQPAAFEPEAHLSSCRTRPVLPSPCRSGIRTCPPSSCPTSRPGRGATLAGVPVLPVPVAARTILFSRRAVASWASAELFRT